MKLYEIVKCLNNHIRETRESLGITEDNPLVLQYALLPDEKFPAYKKIKCILWYVKNKEKYKVLDISYKEKIVGDKIDKAIQNLEDNFLYLVFKWIGSDSYIKVVHNIYIENLDKK